MKLKIEVEIEWLEENGDIDSQVKDEIIQGVKNAISKQCLDKVERKASLEISKAINESIVSARQLIEQKALNFADDWLENEVTITDKWGDAQECLTIKDLIKRSFDQLLEKTVDDKGQFTDGYGSSMKMIEYLTGTRVKSVVADKLKNINREIEKQIEEAIQHGLRESVGKKFAEMVVNTARYEHKQAKLENKPI